MESRGGCGVTRGGADDGFGRGTVEDGPAQELSGQRRDGRHVRPDEPFGPRPAEPDEMGRLQPLSLADLLARDRIRLRHVAPVVVVVGVDQYPRVNALSSGSISRSALSARAAIAEWLGVPFDRFDVEA